MACFLKSRKSQEILLKARNKMELNNSDFEPYVQIYFKLNERLRLIILIKI